jgi:hypothetical protein
VATSKPPDEKSIEVVFAAYAARLAQEMGKTLITYAPSQAKEKKLAYDAKLIRKGCRELYIQFKKSSTNKYGLAFRPSDKAQLNMLKTKYPPLSAFYVAATFIDDDSLFRGQHLLGSADFLDHYFAVDARMLADDSNSVRFRDAILENKTNVGTYPNHGPNRVEHPIYRPFWLTGSELLCAFLRCDSFALSSRTGRSTGIVRRYPSIGSQIVVRNGRVFRLPINNNVEFPEEYDRSWEVDVTNEPLYMPGHEVHTVFRVLESR